MFTHAFLGSNDVERSRTFYDAIMGVLGIRNVMPADAPSMAYNNGKGTLVVGKPYNGEPATYANGGTLGLSAGDDAEVDAWHAAGLAAGGTDDGAPGPRERAPGGARGAYLRDPDGNKLCCFNMPK